MHITEENKAGFEVECGCKTRFFVAKNAGVATCPHCGNVRDPRGLRFKWARRNDPSSPNACQAL